MNKENIFLSGVLLGVLLMGIVVIALDPQEITCRRIGESVSLNTQFIQGECLVVTTTGEEVPLGAFLAPPE